MTSGRAARRLVTLASLVFCAAPLALRAAPLAGRVVLESGKPAAGAFVSVRDSTRGIAWSVRTDADGAYQLALSPGRYQVTAHRRGAEAAMRPVVISTDGVSLDFTLAPGGDPVADAPPHAFLGLLPEGEEKRRFIVDCLGCHSLNPRVLFDAEGRAYDAAAWKASTDKMLSFAGHTTAFPILPPDRESESTAAFAARYLTDDAIAAACAAVPEPAAAALRYEVTEYDLPDRNDFAHDLMRDGTGRVLVTGMFSGRMYALDPASGAFDVVAIPETHPTPRAIDIDANGDWWILCGFPRKLARYAVGERRWDMFDIGVYPHSVRVDANGRVWFNGHFTRDPILLGYVDAATGEMQTLEAPATPMPPEQGSPIPYGLRVGPDGTVWMTELAGNRLVRYQPETGDMAAYTLPSPHSGPRRLDVGPDGTVWIPEYAGGKLARFDPEREAFEEIDFPTPNSLPYCARADQTRNVVWISQCGTSAIARYDPGTRALAELEMPVTVAFIRHLDVDSETGEVWASYSHSPNLHPRVVRLRVVE